MPSFAIRQVLARCAVPVLLTALACRGPMRAPSDVPVAEPLTDNRIVGTALLLNNIEAGMATLALERAAGADVQSYARRMQTDHASLNASLASIIDRLGISAQDDRLGVQLREAALATRERLRATSPREFDAAYIEADLRSHREMLRVSQELLSGARRRALREYLTALGPVLAAHVAHAEQVRAMLAARGR